MNEVQGRVYYGRGGSSRCMRRNLARLFVSRCVDDGADSDRRSSAGNERKRQRFGSKLEGILYCIGSAVGLGDVWRFPFLAYQNGGGAFFFAYLVLMFIIAIPLYSMELAIGQFSSLGPIEVWRCLPIAKGIGYAMVTISTLVAIYYNVILAYTLYYLAQSFRSVLPWANCDEWWGADKETCFVRKKNITLCRSVPYILHLKYGSTSHSNDTSGWTLITYRGVSFLTPLAEYIQLNNTCSDVTGTTSAAEQFWERHVLDLSPGIEHVGGLKWDLAVCLFISWAIVFFCLMQGVTSSGKVMYFTATFPYVMLTVLLIKGVTLDGAMLGIKYFLVPDFSKLTSLTIWQRAAEQVFYSLGIGWGGLIVSGSYNHFRTSIVIQSTIVNVADLLTSFLGGIAIFSVLGYMSVTYGVPVEEVAKAGQGLVFVVFPEALTTFWCPQLWSVVFFVMLYLLGIDSEFPLVQTGLTVLSDAFPVLRKYKGITAFVACTLYFLVGLTCVTRGGQYVLNLLDTYCAGVSLLIVIATEVISLMWIYGVSNLSFDGSFMLGSPPNIFFCLSWTVISPILLLLIITFYFYQWTPITYNNVEPYPHWADAVGMAFAAFSVLQIPVVAICVLLRKKSLQAVFRPESNWGPADKHLFEDYRKFKAQKRSLPLNHRSSIINGHT
ncbi:sodium-dependent proline transporter-like isoform X3 [Varroa jacobsoni]|uniref:sodium-dependent proline transporter-like isoform X3 n=2 Tax=Varroa jacobsoni TaxID=62625 RepID=UPI000BF445B5|nr:sodium-dependent proline transporter-like isoform X3 [Varroa jacobsoni]